MVNEISNAVSNKKKNQKVPDSILQNLDNILKNDKINSTENHILATSNNLVVGAIETGKNTSIRGLKVDKANIDLLNTSIYFLDSG